MYAIITETIDKNIDGTYIKSYSAGAYDHSGNFGYIIYGETSKKSLIKKLKAQGYAIRY
jgi:hypothetical protein